MQLLYDHAIEGSQVKATLNAMKESELELAAQEAADNARHVDLLVRGCTGYRRGSWSASDTNVMLAKR